MYSGSLKQEEVVNCPDLYIAASFYNVKVLARHCELQMMTKVNTEWNNIKSILKFTIFFNALKLKKFLVNLARKIQKMSL